MFPPSPNSTNSSLCLAPLPFLSSSSSFPVDLSSIFLQDSLNMEQPHISTASMADDVTKAKKLKGAPPRRRRSKKDRHSKIYTAKGMRDRRMRLSLDVARKFFDLQDMLGFDKASRTVEWLLNQSESPIHQLKKTLIIGQSLDGLRNSIINNSSSYSPAKIDVTRGESRKMARARAKQRTKEKMWINLQGLKSKLPLPLPAHQQTVVEELGHSLFISSYMSMEDQLDTTRQQLGHHHVLVGDTQQQLYTDLQLPHGRPFFNNACSWPA